jgi:phosphatidylglycerophosphate synthase
MKILERKAKLEITFQKRTEWWSRVFASPIAHFLLIILGDWKYLTPNKLTITSFSLVLLTAGIIISPIPHAFIIAAILLQFAYILDCMDGQLARYRGISTSLGGFLDKSLDFIKFPFILLALTLVSIHNNNILVAILGFGCVFFISLRAYLKEMTRNNPGISLPDILTKDTFLREICVSFYSRKPSGISSYPCVFCFKNQFGHYGQYF